MILQLIIIVSLIQFVLYFLIEKFNLKLAKVLITISVLLLYYFVFPEFFYPEPRKDGINCGVPIMGIFLAFSVIGTIFALGTHLIWYIKKTYF